jgi:hypothetical protein
MGTNEGGLMMQFMAWFNKLDRDTLRLMGRVFSKGVATGDLNGYIKSLALRELGETDKTITATSEEVKV